MAFIGGKTNRQITNKEPIKYLEDEVVAKRGEDALASQLIPTDRKLWEMANYRDFWLGGVERSLMRSTHS